MIYIPIALLLVYMIADSYLLRKARKKIPVVIHVNGIRGKSSVVRMLDQVFRDQGYKTFSKVTGTLPMYRNVHGEEHLIKRNNVTVLEQKRILKEAAKEKADVLLVECMALKGSVQEHSERLLQADLAVITNVRTDHLEVMGASKEAIGRNLLKMTSNGQRLIVGRGFPMDKYPDYAFDVAGSYETINAEIKENTDIVLTVAEQFGLDLDKAVCSVKHAAGDVGRARTVIFRENLVMMGFAMNDLETTNGYYKTYQPEGSKVIWFNDRDDRPKRSEMFLNWLLEVAPEEVLLSGDSIKRNRGFLLKSGFKGKVIDIEDYRAQNQLILGIGNIKGLDELMGEGHV